MTKPFERRLNLEMLSVIIDGTKDYPDKNGVCKTSSIS